MLITKDTKIISFIILSIFLSFILSACSSKKASEHDIKAEIVSFENFDELDLVITSYSETKRKTDKKNKSDIIWVSIIAQNDIIEYRGDYKLQYTKYNNGWILDDIICEKCGYSVKEFVDEERIKNDVLEIYGYYIDQYGLYNVELGEPILLESNDSTGNGEPYCIFSVTCSAENEYALFNADFILSYALDLYDGWFYTENVYHEYDSYTSAEPKGPPEQSLAEAMFEMSSIDTYTLESEQWEGDMLYYFTFFGTDNSYKYLEMHYRISVGCSFDVLYGWYISDYSSELVDVNFDVAGTWIYDDGKGENKYTFNIKTVDSEQVTYTADITMTDWLMVAGTTTYTYSTNGETIQLQWEKTPETDYSLITSNYVLKHEFGLANANYYYLEFRSYTGNQYDESGFYFNDCQLIKQS